MNTGACRAIGTGHIGLAPGIISCEAEIGLTRYTAAIQCLKLDP
jgi:hypothetical protein